MKPHIIKIKPLLRNQNQEKGKWIYGMTWIYHITNCDDEYDYDDDDDDDGDDTEDDDDGDDTEDDDDDGIPYKGV